MSNLSKCKCCKREEIFLNYAYCNGCVIFMKLPLDSFTKTFIDIYKKSSLHFHAKKVKKYKTINEYKAVKDKVKEEDKKKERDDKSKIIEKKMINPEQIYLNL